MTVYLDTGSIVLSGTCGVEDVEALVNGLEDRPDLSVDISSATSVHTAIWQALMVFKPVIVGSPMSSLIASNLLPTLQAHINKDLEGEVQLAKPSSSK